MLLRFCKNTFALYFSPKVSQYRRGGLEQGPRAAEHRSEACVTEGADALGLGACLRYFGDIHPERLRLPTRTPALAPPGARPPPSAILPRRTGVGELLFPSQTGP